MDIPIEKSIFIRLVSRVWIWRSTSHKVFDDVLRVKQFNYHQPLQAYFDLAEGLDFFYQSYHLYVLLNLPQSSLVLRRKMCHQW